VPGGWTGPSLLAEGPFIDLGVVQHWDGRLEIIMIHADGTLWHTYQVFDKWLSLLDKYPKSFDSVSFKGWALPAPFKTKEKLPPMAGISSCSVSSAPLKEFVHWTTLRVEDTRSGQARKPTPSGFNNMRVPLVSVAGEPWFLQYSAYYFNATSGWTAFAPLQEAEASGSDMIGQAVPYLYSGDCDFDSELCEASSVVNALGGVFALPGDTTLYSASRTRGLFDVVFSPKQGPDALALVGNATTRRPPDTLVRAFPYSVRQMAFSGPSAFATLWSALGLFTIKAFPGDGDEPTVVTVDSIWDSEDVIDFSLCHRDHPSVFFLSQEGRLFVWEEAVSTAGTAEVGFANTGYKQVAAGRHASGRLEAFVRKGADEGFEVDHVYEATPGKWAGAEKPFGVHARKLHVGVNVDGRLELFYIGVDYHLHHIYQTAPG